MRRREFIGLVGGAAAWPLVVEAQQHMPVVGWLSMRSASDSAFAVNALSRGLAETGYTIDQNVGIEYRWLDNNYQLLPAAVHELVERPVAVIVVIGSTIAALAAKAATSTTPIVFANGGDPVKDGLVPRLNRPGENVTGASFVTVALGAKRLELLHELVPTAAKFAMLARADRLDTESQIGEAEAAARSQGVVLRAFKVTTVDAIDEAFSTMSAERVHALLVGTDPFFTSQRHRLAALAARHRIPAIYTLREYVESGGLASYGASISDAFRQAGFYAGRILRGESPGDLPIMLPTKFELAINLRTAKELGLTVQPMLLARADEVIE
jgi:putative ABC transport system substrate-binding protein